MFVNPSKPMRQLFAPATLHLKQPAPSRGHAAAGPVPFSMAGLSPAVADALLRINEIVNG